MFDITLITMGKLKEKFYLSAAEEYAKDITKRLIKLEDTLADNLKEYL